MTHNITHNYTKLITAIKDSMLRNLHSYSKLQAGLYNIMSNMSFTLGQWITDLSLNVLIWVVHNPPLSAGIATKWF